MAYWISCTDCPGPGQQWTITVNFKSRSSSHFEILALSESGTEREVFGPYMINRPVTFQNMAKSLVELDEDIRVYGQYEDLLEFSEKIPFYAQELFKLAFCVNDDSCFNRELLLDFFCGLSNEELINFFNDFGTPSDPIEICYTYEGEELKTDDVYSDLTEFIENVFINYLGKPLHEIKAIVGLDPEISLKELFIQYKQEE